MESTLSPETRLATRTTLLLSVDRASSRHEFRLRLALVVLVAAAFFPVLSLGFVTWDDNVYIDDSAISGTTLASERLSFIFQSFLLSNYNPLHRVGNWVQRTLFARDPSGYHLVSVLLHLANVLLVFALVRRWGSRDSIAFVAALLFGVHPVRAENVAWFSSQKDLGSALFILLALIAYAPILRGETRRPFACLGAVWVLFALGILYKSMVLTFPALLLLLDVAWRRPFRRALLEKLPFFALSALFAWLTVDAHPPVRPIGGSWESHAATAVQAPWWYLSRVVWPVDYSARFFVPRHESFFTFAPLVSALGLVVVGLVSCFVICTRARARRTVLLAIAWPALVLAPVLNLVPITTVIADRFLYLALLGPFVVAAEGIVVLLRGGRRPWMSRFAFGGFAAIALSCVALSWSHSGAFSDTDTLWKTSLATQPHNPVVRIFRAQSLARGGSRENAAAALEMLDGIRSEGLRRTQMFLIARYRALHALGRYDESSQALEDATTVANEDGWNVGTAIAVADRHVDRGDWGGAHEVLDRADGHTGGARQRIYSTHASYALRRGDDAEFLRWNAKILDAQPFAVLLWHNREQIARRAGRLDEVARCKSRVEALLGS